VHNLRINIETPSSKNSTWYPFCSTSMAVTFFGWKIAQKQAWGLVVRHPGQPSD
jgi:hypothetical protein